jgi:tRNA (guanine-N7-)-methyltransferase
MGQKKLIRFEAIRHFPNVLEYPQNMRGEWHTFFTNINPITLELACGKGEYAVGLARLHPEENFIGIDIKGNRIWRGAKTALDEQLTQVAFIRSSIDKITDYFAPGEISAIWITFPDPQPRDSREHKRLTSPEFLERYRSFAAPGCTINLKTDSRLMYDYTLSVVKAQGLTIEKSTDDLYQTNWVDEVLSIKTTYERIWLSQGAKICYLRFQL